LKSWLVVYTRPRWEKKVAASFAAQGIEHYCPLNKVTKQWTDRKKIVLEPLFRGYVFVCRDNTTNTEIRKTEGVINFIFWNRLPAVVKDKEIDIIKRFLGEFTDIIVSDINPAVNDNVTVKQGIFMDHKGIILEIFGNKAKVKIESMGIQLTAIFERKNIMKVLK
jgi:transcription antitermination factor NusG